MQENHEEPAGRHRRRRLTAQAHLGLRALFLDTVSGEVRDSIEGERPFHRADV
jgi:hypothetical protein